MRSSKKRRLNWKLIRRITYGYKRYLFLAIVAVLCSIFLSYAIPMVTSFAIDSVLAGQDVSLPGIFRPFMDHLGGPESARDNLTACAMLLLFLTLLDGLCSHVRSRLVNFASEGSAMTLRNALYEHLQNVPYDYHKHTSVGDLVQRCSSDVEIVRRFVSMQFIEIVRTITRVVIAAVILFSIHVPLTFLSMSTLPILFLISFFYFKKVRAEFVIADDAEGELSATLQENLTGVRVVRAFGQQKSEMDKFTEKNKAYRHLTYRVLKLLAYYWGGTDALCYLQIALSTAAGVYLAATTTTFTLGNVLLFSSYTGMLTWPVRQLGRILADMGRATVAMERLDEILSAPLEQEPGKALKPEIRGNIQFSHVNFGYDYPDEVLKDISFEVRSGQTIGILGATGSGKSSLVQLLQRLYPVTGGHIYLDGVDINDIEHEHLRSHIGIVLQEPFLYSRSILDNIRITDPSASAEEVYSAAKAAAVHDVIQRFDKGYDTLVGERGVTLSGGQQQRVAIARTLMRKTPILIFDDSMSAVDTETDQAIRKALRGIRGQSTTFIISHRITTLMESDRILVLDQGRLVEEGTHAELLSKHGIYSRIAEIQEATGQVRLDEKGASL